MKMIIKSQEISKVAKTLANNNFINVKDVNKLARYLHVSLSNFYILSMQMHFIAYLKYNKDFENETKFLKILIIDYNFLFNEDIAIKKEDIEIIIIEGGDNDK